MDFGLSKKKPQDKKNKPDEKKPQPPVPPQPVKKPLAEAAVPTAVTKQIDGLMRRLRLLEERYSSLRKKDQFLEQNMLRDTKNLTDEIKLLNEMITRIKNETSEISEKLTKLSEEVLGSVKKTEFNVLVKYLEYWEPLSFLTRKEAVKIIEEMKGSKTE